MAHSMRGKAAHERTAEEDALPAFARHAPAGAWNIAAAIMVAALWAAARPYRGVRHDSILYLGQTLGRMFPDSIGQDIFLAYGSQDKYSLYSRLMEPLVQWLGVAAAHIAVLLGVQVAFVAAAWLLTKDLPSRWLRWAALVALAALPHTYGGLGSFSFAEPFLTARAIAEPFALIALALVLRNRPTPAIAFALLALAFHPLLTLPLIIASWVCLALRDRRWWHAAWLFVLPLGLAAAGIAPFDALFARFDPAWWAGVVHSNTNAFIANLGLLDWAPTLFDVTCLWLAMRALRGTPLATFLRALLWTALAFTALWGLGADVLHDVLLTQLQLWRVYWLTHLFALLVLPMLLARELARGAAGAWAAAALLLAAVAVGGNFPSGWLCVAWAWLAVAVSGGRTVVSPGVMRLGALVSLMAAGLVTFVVARKTWMTVEHFTDRFDDTSWVQVVIGTALVGGALGIALLHALSRGSALRALAAAFALCGFAVAAVSWDQRSDWQIALEHGLERPQPVFADVLPPHATVMWNEDMLASWMLLRRPEYFSDGQGAGLLFNRATAVEFMHRVSVFRELDYQRHICSTFGSVIEAVDPRRKQSELDCAPSIAVVEDLCRMPAAPDYMVFEADPDTDPAAARAVARWDFRSTRQGLRKSFVLYECATLRGAAPEARPAARKTL